MSSEAITRNDLTNILNEVLPPTSSEYRKLLWTNPSPTASFSAQTISLDLTGYDFIDIEMTAYKSNITFPTTTRLPTTGFSSGTWIQSYAESASNWAGYRRVTPSSTGITFGNGGFAYFDSTTNNLNNNDYGIPLKIYGIKYERIAPPQVDASDYVIEQGTSGIWIYRKWDSGIAECWCRWVSSQTMTSAEGYGYYSSLASLNFPTGLFTDIPVVSFGTANGGGLGNFSLNSINTASFNGYWWATISSTRTCTANIYAIGRWK